MYVSEDLTEIDLNFTHFLKEKTLLFPQKSLGIVCSLLCVYGPQGKTPIILDQKGDSLGTVGKELIKFNYYKDGNKLKDGFFL